MTDEIKIIPAAEAPTKDTTETRGRPTKYPFDCLNVGDCFEVPKGKLQAVRQAVSNKNRAIVAPGEPEGPKFTVAKGNDGKWYVWRES